jgi:cation diffusion facilitator CzcD-associated flavoprotein CzcO
MVIRVWCWGLRVLGTLSVYHGRPRRELTRGYLDWRETVAKLTKTRFAIIGAGAGGICAGIKLRESGRQDFLIFDRESQVGGTWHRNTYPGAACDIASHLYSYSFAPSADWSRPYAQQPEIQQYLERVALEGGLRDHLRLGVTVEAGRWSEEDARWRLTLDSGEEVEAQFVISALGMFGEIAVPDIPGLDTFSGAMFHSAEWDHGHDLTGERVAVIGSAASAVQFVPEVAPEVERLHVFQRTANWVLPKDDTPFSDEQRQGFRERPELLEQSRQQIFEVVETALTYTNPEPFKIAEQLGRDALKAVEDPEVRAKLTPDHPFGCKRPLISNTYLQSFNRSNVELVVDPIREVTPNAIVTTDGGRREVDTILLATGFQTTRYASAIDFTGRAGRRMRESWSDGPEAYLGLTTSGFPNLFMLYGPNTNGGNSIILMLEYQVAYLMRLIAEVEESGVGWIDVRREVMDDFNRGLQEELDGIEVLQASCNGYYRAGSGRIVTQWPHNFAEYSARVDRDDLSSFESGGAASPG